MNMVQAVKSVFRNYADFRGRASRSEYWWYNLAYFIFVLILSLLTITLLDEGPLIRAAFSLILFVPTLAVSVRRLHDLDKSGWNVLWGFTIIGLIFPLLVWYIRRGTEGYNRFGPPVMGRVASGMDEADHEADDEDETELA